jgi:hypothetical protein
MKANYPRRSSVTKLILQIFSSNSLVCQFDAKWFLSMIYRAQKKKKKIIIFFFF